MPDKTIEEVKATVIEMKNKRSPGGNSVETRLSAMSALSNQCLQ